MSSRPIRIGEDTLTALREQCKGTGEPLERLAERYLSEGLRRDRHPGIIFRDGPAGRRAGVVGGPDVWEIIGAVRSMPERREARVPALAERLGLPASKIRIALRYYGEYPGEIDDRIAANDAEADRLELAPARERDLLGEAAETL